MIGLGTAAIGRPHYINLRQETPPPFQLEAFKSAGKALLEAAYQSGIRYFDTAPGYGIAEQLLIDWVREHPEREVEIATKWGYTYTANFDLHAKIHELKEHTLSKLNEQWAQSQQLIPHLSTYQIHSATFASRVLENQEVLDRLAVLKAKHGIRIGLSVSGADQVAIVKKALKIERDGAGLFEVFQVTYNMLDQSLMEVAEELKAGGKRIVIKEALANGRVFRANRFPHYGELYDEIERIAKRYEVGVDAVALRFVMDSLQPFTVLSGASVPVHLTGNLKANSFRLETAEIERLKRFGVKVEAYWGERKNA